MPLPEDCRFVIFAQPADRFMIYDLRLQILHTIRSGEKVKSYIINDRVLKSVYRLSFLTFKSFISGDLEFYRQSVGMLSVTFRHPPKHLTPLIVVG